MALTCRRRSSSFAGMRLVTAAITLLCLLAGCSAAPLHEAKLSPPPSSAADSGTTVPVGRSTQSLTIDGRQRDVNLYRPKTPTQPLSLVVVLHGGGGSAATAEAAYGWDRAADAHGFVVAYPESVGKAWNAGTCCGAASATGVDDVGFIVAVAHHVAAQVPIDEHYIYLTGFSNGAMLTYRVACESDDVFAAFAPVSGTQLVDCTGARPASMIDIHGTADPNVPYSGGPGQGVAGLNGPSAVWIDQFWRGIGQCAAPLQQSGSITTSTASCPDGHSVELITIDGGGHHWPGSVTSRGNPSNAADNALNATETIWSFFGGRG